MHLLPRASHFRGTLFRACSPNYASTRDLLSGAGSAHFGGRWNHPRSFPTVYLADSVEGAIAETLGVAGTYGFRPERRLPLTLVAVKANLHGIIDLTDIHDRRHIDVTVSELMSCPWRRDNARGRESLTQAIGRAAKEAGAAGIIAPSAMGKTWKNLSAFPANFVAGRLTILRADRLPPPSAGRP